METALIGDGLACATLDQNLGNLLSNGLFAGHNRSDPAPRLLRRHPPRRALPPTNRVLICLIHLVSQQDLRDYVHHAAGSRTEMLVQSAGPGS